MTLSPHVRILRAGVKWAMLLYRSMIRTALWDAFNGYHMGQTDRKRSQKNGRSAARPPPPPSQDEIRPGSQNKARPLQRRFVSTTR